MYNLDQVTHKLTSINSGKNAFNPYNSVTKVFFPFVLKIYLWGSSVRTHRYIPLALMCVGHE